MKKLLSIFLILAVLLNLGCSSGSGSPENNLQTPLIAKLTMTDVLEVETNAFQEGTPILFLFSLDNPNNEEITLKFSSGQHIEVVIFDSNQNEVRRLSDNLVYLQVLNEVPIPPLATVNFPVAAVMTTEQLAAGNYTVTVTLVENDIQVTQEFSVVQLEPLNLSASLIVKDSFGQPVNIFNQGEIVTFELQLKNEGLQKAILVFDDSQTHDVIITDPQILEQIWELAEGSFTEVSYIAIEPGETIIRSENFDQVLTNGEIIQSGIYDVKAWYSHFSEVQTDTFAIQ